MSTDDDERRRFMVVTEENADQIIRERSLAAMRADDKERIETLTADNPMRLSGQGVGEWNDVIDGCARQHVYVVGDLAARTLTCRDCGASVDPLSWIFHAAKPVERLLRSELYVRREISHLETTVEEKKRELAKLRAEIRKELERAAKIGIAIEGTKGPQRWNWSPDRIVSETKLEAGISFVTVNGGVVRVDDSGGTTVAYIVHPSMRWVPR